MATRFFLFFCCALTVLICQCQERALESEISRRSPSRSLRQVDGEGSDFEVSGKSGSSKTEHHTVLRLACDHAIEDFRNIASREDLPSTAITPLVRELEDNDQSYFVYKKLYPNSRDSICQNLNLTCCKPVLEKISNNLARDEYKFYYDELFQEHLQTCISPGKRLLKSSIQILGGLIQEVETRVNQSLAGTLPPDTFTALSKYMISFISASMPHICPLPGILQDLTDSLIELTLDNIFDTDEDYNYIMADPESANCMLNVSATLVQEQRSKIQSSLERQLEDMSLLSQSLEMVRAVLEVMRSHTFSPSCQKGIMHMRFCSLCGGYGDFRPCLFMCINTLQGCFADLAEMHSDYTKLTSLMRELSDDLVRELSPEIFTQSYMNQFVLIVQELREKQDDLTDALLGECAKNHSSGELTRTRRSGTLFQPIQGPKNQPKLDPLLEQLDPSQLSTVIKAEMGCLDKIADKMVGISEEICTLDSYDDAIAHKGNTLCWTGTTMGRYEHPKAGVLKQDQLKNPAYSGIPMTTEILYADVINDIRTLAQKINAIISFNKLCQQSDDEDCYRDSYRYCGTVKPPISPPTYSGSGSGSDPYTTDDNEDQNTTTTDVFTMHVPTTTEEKIMDQTTLGNELRDGILPPRSTAKPVTVIRIQDGFDNSIPSSKELEKPGFVPKPPSEPVDPGKGIKTEPTATTLANSDTDLGDTTEEANSFDSSTTTHSNIATNDHSKTTHTTSDIANKVTGSLDESIQVGEKIPIISSSASLHVSRILSSILITCLCTLVFVF